MGAGDLLFTGTTAQLGRRQHRIRTALTGYALLLVVLVMARLPTPYDLLSGSRIAYRPSAADSVVHPKALGKI